MKGDNLPSFTTSSDVKTLTFFVKKQNSSSRMAVYNRHDVCRIPEGTGRPKSPIFKIIKCFYFYDNTIIAWHNNNYIRQQDYIHV